MNLMPKIKKLPKKYQPKGFEILHEDRDIIIGNKAVGFLTVGAMYDRLHTVHNALNQYVRKGSLKSRKCVYVVHRLDRETSGVLVFAKTETAQFFLKDHWKSTVKTYNAVVHGRFAQKTGTISSYLIEDDEYVMHSTADGTKGKLSHTAYSVIKETDKFSLLHIDLLTGRKNQIRVHMADAGHPIVGDTKYGKSTAGAARLALHARSIIFTHTFSGQRLTFEAPLPQYFNDLVHC